jgi:hypothetical protein
MLTENRDAALVTYSVEILKGTTMKKTVNTALITTTLLAILLPGCANYYAHTREDVIAHPRTKQWSLTVPRKLDDVVSSLNKQAVACVNKQYSQTRSGMSVSRSVQIMTIKKVSASKAELDYRQLSNNVIGQPKDGILIFTANFESRGPKSTVATLYNGNEPLRKALQEWIKGNDNSCHGYGG